MYETANWGISASDHDVDHDRNSESDHDVEPVAGLDQ